MAAKDVAPVLAKEFIPLKLDYDRMPGAKDLMLRFAGKDMGLPWFVFLSGDGKAAATATMADGNNTGFPAKPEEIAHFKTMLEKSKRRLTAEDVAFLVRSLEEANKKNP